jgi:hypothetical protein
MGGLISPRVIFNSLIAMSAFPIAPPHIAGRVGVNPYINQNIIGKIGPLRKLAESDCPGEYMQCCHADCTAGATQGEKPKSIAEWSAKRLLRFSPGPWLSHGRPNGLKG